MRGVIGPILTTGVSLVTAGIVVANPIVAPRADIAIPAVQLSSGNSETIGMLDQAFLDAIAPGPAGSSNPFSVLKQLITGLASDATSLGRNAMVDAFVAGVAAVSQPELTASSYPYIAAPVFAPAGVPPGGFGAGLPARIDSGVSGPVIVTPIVEGCSYRPGCEGSRAVVALCSIWSVRSARTDPARPTISWRNWKISGSDSGSVQHELNDPTMPPSKSITAWIAS